MTKTHTSKDFPVTFATRFKPILNCPEVAILFIGALLSALPTQAEECNPSTPISAHYQVTSRNSAQAGDSTTKQLVLWRHKNSVAEQFPAKGITEIWERNHSNSIKLNRYFDAYQRGIEYSPSEVKNVNSDNDWSMKTQLVADSLLNKMNISNREGSGCEREETYLLTEKNYTATLVWLPAYRLVKSYHMQRGPLVQEWTLSKKTTDKNDINHFFSKYSDYKTTDYADIGDNESDPFLRKMIRLGFIEHGSSGMYDAQGNDIGGEHHH